MRKNDALRPLTEEEKTRWNERKAAIQAALESEENPVRSLYGSLNWEEKEEWLRVRLGER